MALRSLLLMTLLTVGPAALCQSDWWYDPDEQGVNTAGEDRRPLSERSFRERLTFGGNGAFQLGTITLIGGTPQVGYRVTENVMVGIGGTYYYNRWKDIGYTQHLYGGNLWARRKLFSRVFVHVESEHINIEAFGPLLPEAGRRWVDMLWVGGGYYQGVTDRLGAGITLLYDVSENSLNPYDNPTIRGGLSLGF